MLNNPTLNQNHYGRITNYKLEISVEDLSGIEVIERFLISSFFPINNQEIAARLFVLLEQYPILVRSIQEIAQFILESTTL